MSPGPPHTAARALWLAVTFTVLGGYALDAHVAATRLDARRSDNELTAARLRATDVALAEQPRLDAERARLQRVLRDASVADETHLVARFVRDAAREAALHHAAVTAIAAVDGPGPPPAASGPPGPAVRAAAAATIGVLPLDLIIDGCYADVLATIRRLSHLHVVAGVDVTSLVRKNADSPDPSLSAALRVTIARLTGPEHAFSRTQ